MGKTRTLNRFRAEGGTKNKEAGLNVQLSWARVKAHGEQSIHFLNCCQVQSCHSEIKEEWWVWFSIARRWMKEVVTGVFEGVVEPSDIRPLWWRSRVCFMLNHLGSQICKGRPVPATDFLIQLVCRCSSALRVFGGSGHPDVQRLWSAALSVKSRWVEISILGN